ncbi:hypothetical protein ABZ468_28245 [Streptomyces sp. NPDC005708]|uniref:hypothetical protein n=1 Tax=Streptomyces sp. NPDC005708 TaxID=3154564 RepID=UPI0033D0AB48
MAPVRTTSFPPGPAAPAPHSEEDRSSAADRLLNVELALVATKSLVVELFADDGDQSSLRPVPTR